MLRRSFLRFALVVAALLALTTPAFAGGVAVEFDTPPTGAEASVAWTFGFAIRSAHEDRTPQPGLTPIIKASKMATDEQVTTTAKAEGAAGHYVATLTFPSAGAWQWRMQPFGDSEYVLTLPGPLQVRAKGAQAPAAPKAAPTKVVDSKASDDSFDPKEQTIPAGTTVTWHMIGKHAHTVTSEDGSFASGNLDAGQNYSFTFTKPGTYAYYCEYHGGKGGQGMAGTIIVTAVESSAPSALPKTGGTDLAPFVALLAALLAAAIGMGLRWRRGRSSES
jgi:LPXTG-motif cell wall-anchored protein